MPRLMPMSMLKRGIEVMLMLRIRNEIMNTLSLHKNGVQPSIGLANKNYYLMPKVLVFVVMYMLMLVLRQKQTLKTALNQKLKLALKPELKPVLMPRLMPMPMPMLKLWIKVMLMLRLRNEIRDSLSLHKKGVQPSIGLTNKNNYLMP